MCDICFKPIFDREFYVFPCTHAFHRVCIEQKLRDYKPKNPAVKAVLDQVKSQFQQMHSIREKAIEIAKEQARGQSVSNFGGFL